MSLLPLVIVGAGGHGREVLDIVLALNEVQPTYDFLGFVDDGRDAGEVVAPHDARVLGNLTTLESMDVAYVPAIGSTSVRRDIVKRFAGRPSPSLIHPRASVGTHVEHGEGLVVAAGATLTHGIRLGDHVHVNVNASISHDCQIGNFVTITPGAHLSGNVHLEDGVWMGIGSVVIQGITIGQDAFIGAGAAVVHDLPAGRTAVGVPARVMPSKSKGDAAWLP